MLRGWEQLLIICDEHVHASSIYFNEHRSVCGHHVCGHHAQVFSVQCAEIANHVRLLLYSSYTKIDHRLTTPHAQFPYRRVVLDYTPILATPNDLFLTMTYIVEPARGWQFPCNVRGDYARGRSSLIIYSRTTCMNNTGVVYGRRALIHTIL